MPNIRSIHTESRGRTHRAGSAMIELIVAAVLVVAMFGVLAPMTIQSGRLWQDTRRDQLAMDELANQLELLMALPADQRTERLEDLTVTEGIGEVLPEAELRAEQVNDQDGQRIVLTIQWNQQAPRPPRTLQLVGWTEFEEDPS